MKTGDVFSLSLPLFFPSLVLGIAKSCPGFTKKLQDSSADPCRWWQGRWRVAGGTHGCPHRVSTVPWCGGTQCHHPHGTFGWAPRASQELVVATGEVSGCRGHRASSALPDLSQLRGDAVETSGVLFCSEVSRSALCIFCNRFQLSVLKNLSEYLATEINTPAPIHVEQGLALAARFPHQVSSKHWLQHGSAPAPGAPRGTGGIYRGVHGEMGSGHGVVPAAVCESQAPLL